VSLVRSFLHAQRCVCKPLTITLRSFLGISATAVQTGTEVKNRYFSEPHHLAGNIIALDGMLKNILKVADTLRDAVARDKIMTDRLNGESANSSLPETVAEVYSQNKGGLLAGMTAGRLGMAGMEVGQMATAAEAGTMGARNARFFSRTSSNLLRTARFARFAGGALSAFTLLLEAKCMNDTIQDIKAGNPCDKAKKLRSIKEGLEQIASTSDLDRECENYLEAMDKRDRRMTEQEAVRLLLETTAALAESERESAAPGGTLIVDGDDTPRPASASASTAPTSSSMSPASGSTSLSASLLQRIQLFKNKQANSVEMEPAVSIDEAPADLLC
jgi:hypothetical protein